MVASNKIKNNQNQPTPKPEPRWEKSKNLVIGGSIAIMTLLGGPKVYHSLFPKITNKKAHELYTALYHEDPTYLPNTIQRQDTTQQTKDDISASSEQRQKDLNNIKEYIKKLYELKETPDAREIQHRINKLITMLEDENLSDKDLEDIIALLTELLEFVQWNDGIGLQPVREKSSEQIAEWVTERYDQKTETNEPIPVQLIIKIKQLLTMLVRTETGDGLERTLDVMIVDFLLQNQLDVLKEAVIQDPDDALQLLEQIYETINNIEDQDDANIETLHDLLSELGEKITKLANAITMINESELPAENKRYIMSYLRDEFERMLEVDILISNQLDELLHDEYPETYDLQDLIEQHKEYKQRLKEMGTKKTTESLEERIENFLSWIEYIQEIIDETEALIQEHQGRNEQE